MSSQPLGGSSRPGRLLGPALDKIIKNVAWRKHSHLVAACKSALDRLQNLTDAPEPVLDSPLPDLSLADADLVIFPLILALDSSSPKISEAALECTFKLISLGYLRGEIDRVDPLDSANAPIASRLLDSICRCGGLGDDSIELTLLKVSISSVRSPALLIRSDLLFQIVKSCYNVYLSSLSGTNQICAKAVLSQIVTIVFERVETDSLDNKFRPVSVSDLLELSDKGLNDWNLVQSVQNFINEIVETSEGVPPLILNNSLPEQEMGNGEGPREGDEEMGNGVANGGGDSKIREDGLSLFKNLCKFSMKFGTQENPDDNLLLRGKVLSLELLRVVMENAGAIWRTNEKFLGAIKQYLCLSLLKNSALSAMSIFQLLCSIFENLLSRFRSELKSEIGIFFPMLILRVLENVLQPSFLQKMTVLNMLGKMCQDSQLMVDIFVNYDCDVDAPNIFERYLQDRQWPFQNSFRCNSWFCFNIVSVPGSHIPF